ncbi:MAG: diadenylate cyclase CdaA [Bacteroidaceae bacterium]|nr:diadenylate cyclase CdaA [Bacteroidaceae bacterium]
MDYFTSFSIKDLADILCVALLLFYIYKMMKRTGSLNMFIGIIIFIFIWMAVSQVLQMPMLGAILDKLIDVGALALIVLFADDIRRFFRSLGARTRTGRIYRWMFQHRMKGSTPPLHPIVGACSHLSASRTGALIVIKRNDEVDGLIQIGEKLDAELNQSLIENIFFKNTPLHDGAMVISNGRIESAACILPVSHKEDIPKQFGLRHRAALGIAQACDAIAVVVSEETGGISVFEEDKYDVDIKPDELETFLTNHI